jgi:transcription elongation factor SPT5
MFAFMHNRDYQENGGVFVSYARSLVSTAPKGHKIQPGTGMNPDRGGMAPPPVPQASAGAGRPDGRINRKVAVTKGTYKGYIGRVKDVSNGQARIELHTNNKTITIPVANVKELK